MKLSDDLISSILGRCQRENEKSNGDDFSSFLDILKVATKKSGPSGLINIVFSILMVVMSIYTMRVLANISIWYKAIFILVVFLCLIWCLHMNYRLSKILEYTERIKKKRD